jgi:hypothetical protein
MIVFQIRARGNVCRLYAVPVWLGYRKCITHITSLFVSYIRHKLMKCNLAVNEQLHFSVQNITSVGCMRNGEWRYCYQLMLLACV